MKIKTAILALLLSASALSAAASNKFVASMERDVNQYYQEDMGLPYESMNVRIYNLGDDTLVYEYRGKMIRATAGTESPKDYYIRSTKYLTSGDWAVLRAFGYRYFKVKVNGGSYSGAVQL